MKRTIIALALSLGFALGGAALIPSGAAHAQGTTWNTNTGGGVIGGGGQG